MNCVHEYFGAYSKKVVFLKSRVRTELQEPGFSASEVQRLRRHCEERWWVTQHHTGDGLLSDLRPVLVSFPPDFC